MKIQAFIVTIALFTTGCAVQKISGQVVSSDLNRFTVNAGKTKIMGDVAVGHRVPGTDGVGFLPYVSVGAFIAGAVAGGVATGNAQTGIALQQAISAGTPSPESPHSVRASDIYVTSIEGLLKSGSSLAYEPPENGIFATPFITLRELEGGQHSLACAVNFSGYASGSRKWTSVVSHISTLLLPRSVLQNLGGPEFLQGSGSCFRLVSDAFIQYAKGKYDGNFKGGRLTLKNGAVFRGTFARDDEREIFLEMLVTSYPQGMIVMRSADFRSLSFD